MDKKKKNQIKKIDCPTEVVEPENFLNNDQVYELLASRENYTFKQEDELKLLNCVHCNACETSEERCQLNHKFLEDGREIPGLKNMLKNFENNRTPYLYGEMRIIRPNGIPEKSDTLYYMGCLSTIRIPKYTSTSIEYLLVNNIDFTILDKEVCCGYPFYVSGAFKEFEQCKKENLEIFKDYKRIICTCPACLYIFNEHYQNETDTKFVFITEYLRRSEKRKTGQVGVQHLCQLMYRGLPGKDEQVDQVLKDSGYEVMDLEHQCCGGGLGYMHKLDIIDKIAQKRIQNFKNSDYYTSYCPACYWILYYFGKKIKIHLSLKSLFELLM